MFTIRNIGGASLFLFGTTFVWLTPEFARSGADTSGIGWLLARVGSLVVMLGFTAATWGLFHRSGWWEQLAVGSAAMGVAVLVPYWVAAHQSGEPSPWWNVFVHAIGAAGVFALLLVPTLERWVSDHVSSGS